jgi:hypothetical protein
MKAAKALGLTIPAFAAAARASGHRVSRRGFVVLWMQCLSRRAARCITLWSLALLLFGAIPASAFAQVFIASRPQPEFSIGPLFVSTSVGQQDLESVAHGSSAVPVSVSWSLTPAPHKRAADIAQDLYLLWPGEVVGTTGAAGADPSLARQVEALGFKIKQHGGVRLSARARTDMGTSAEPRTLGAAPFVAFGREGGPAGGARGASYIRIPWVPEMASLDWLVRLELPMKNVIVPRRVSWIEDTFWGRRYLITLGFGDVGYVSLYPLYFGARDRIVPLARDFSMLVINFADADHLKVDEMVPSSASRRTSETRSNTEAFRLPLLPSEGLTPQVLKVQFAYFAGRLAWRPILISALFLGLGNVTGPLVGALARRLGRTLRARVHVGRAEAPGREKGAIPSDEALKQIRPGETTYDDVLRLCGPQAEEEARLPAGETRALQTRTLIYRGQRVVPNRRRSFGWFATVGHWDVEDHEVQIDFERDRVRDVQARVRRSRLAAQPLG